MSNVSVTAMPRVGPDTERENETAETGHAREIPVFAAPDGRRRRRLRMAAVTFIVLVTLWLVGLVAGMLGFDALPALHVPAPSTGSTSVTPSASPLPVSVQARHALQGESGAAATTHSETTRGSTGEPAANRRAAIRRADGTAVPGSTKKTVRPAPAAQTPAATGVPATRPGRRVGQTDTSTTTTTTTTPTPPGQAKDGSGPAAPALEHSSNAGGKPKS